MTTEIVGERLTDPKEIEFLLRMRELSETDQARMERVIQAMAGGTLDVSVEAARAMSAREVRELADSLPEVVS